SVRVAVRVTVRVDVRVAVAGTGVRVGVGDGTTPLAASGKRNVFISFAAILVVTAPPTNGSDARSVSINVVEYAAAGPNALALSVRLVAPPASSQTRAMMPRSPSSAGLTAVTTTFGELM